MANKPNEAGNNTPEKLNRIVEGTNIEGDVHSETNIRVDGKVKGTIETNGRVVIGASGVVDGEVKCHNGDIEGTLKGKITVKELLSLKATSELDGDIMTEKLAIEPGAKFTGTCNMGNQKGEGPSGERARETAQKQQGEKKEAQKGNEKGQQTSHNSDQQARQKQQKPI